MALPVDRGEKDMDNDGGGREPICSLSPQQESGDWPPEAQEKEPHAP